MQFGFSVLGSITKESANYLLIAVAHRTLFRI